MIDRSIQDHITGISTDKKKVLISGMVELLYSISDELEQMARHIEDLEKKVNDMEGKIKLD